MDLGSATQLRFGDDGMIGSKQTIKNKKARMNVFFALLTDGRLGRLAAMPVALDRQGREKKSDLIRSVLDGRIGQCTGLFEFRTNSVLPGKGKPYTMYVVEDALLYSGDAYAPNRQATAALQGLW